MLISIHMLRMDELRQRLIEGRAAQPVTDVETGEAFTEAIDEMAAVALAEKLQHERDLDERARRLGLDRMADDAMSPDAQWRFTGAC